MPSAAPRQEAPRRGAAFLALILVSAAVVAARLPFLLAGTRFFDSDEAVEGLMARHVLGGEFPLFLWGQRYKGVPEVYLAAAAFRLWGPGVVALKAVSLACFAAYAALNFRLVARLFSSRVAWIATAFLIACPPAFVQWTLSGSAEIVMTLLAGTTLLLGVHAWRLTGSRAGLLVAAAALGFGLWIQQYIVYYVVAVAVALIDWSPQGRARARAFVTAEKAPGWIRVVLRLPAAAAGLYIVLGLAAFVGLGFGVSVFGVPITVGDPQKMWWIAAGFLLITAAGLAAVQLTLRQTWSWWVAPAAAFFAGYSPAIVGRFLGDGTGSPRARLDLEGLIRVLPQFAGVAVPVLFGFRSPATELLAVPGWTALLIVAVVLISYVTVARTVEPTDAFHSVFHIFLILTPVLFLASGSYIDAQSYRYLMPIHAALPIVYATGIDAVLRANRFAGAVLMVALVSLFAAQQIDWYRRLAPDREAQAIVECLDRAGVRRAHGDYWLSYKLTFLTGERVIVAPTNGVDRYPPYTALVKADPSAPEIEALCRP